MVTPPYYLGLYHWHTAYIPKYCCCNWRQALYAYKYNKICIIYSWFYVTQHKPHLSIWIRKPTFNKNINIGCQICILEKACNIKMESTLEQPRRSYPPSMNCSCILEACTDTCGWRLGMLWGQRLWRVQWYWPSYNICRLQVTHSVVVFMQYLWNDVQKLMSSKCLK